MFDNSITMPIPFKDKLDVKGLKQGLYNLTRHD